jgi:thiosulfate reductase cytochrome b subunit
MAGMRAAAPPSPTAPDALAGRLVRRHALATRLTHWVNALAVILLLMTGLQIFNAHPRLYWGAFGSWPDAAWLEMLGQDGRGWLRVGGLTLDTTGWLGWSGGEARGFPAWATLPGWRDLANGRNWHFAAAWLMVMNGLLWWALSLSNRHFARDILPRAPDLVPRAIAHDIAEHARLRFPRGAASLAYQPLQKLSYFAVVAILLPLLVATGLCMSPWAGAVAPGIVDLFGGRQSARTIHFLAAMALAAFIAVHLAMVLLSGPWNQLRAMVTGRWRVPPERAAGASAEREGALA